MSEETITTEAAPAPENKGKKFEVSVEGVENASPQPTTITLQTPTDEELAAANEARNRIEQHSEQTKLEMSTGAEKLGNGVQPALSRIEAEMEAGRQAVAKHVAREAMLAAKRADNSSESDRVAAATETNKDL